MQSDGAVFQKKVLAVFHDVNGKFERYESIKKSLSSFQNIEFKNCTKADEVVLELKKAETGLYFFSTSNKEDLSETLLVLLQLEGLLKRQLVRSCGYNTHPLPKVEKILFEKGVSEILTPNLSEKAMAIKADRWLKIIASGQKKDSKKESFLKAGKSTEKEKTAKVIEWGPSLGISCDYWLVMKQTEVRRIMGKWMLELMGPPPSEVKWREIANDQWELEINRPDGAYRTLPGKWVFCGNRPEFSFSSCRWLFIGEEAALYYYVDEKKTATRFEVSLNHDLKLAKNSEQAVLLLPKICEELEKEIRISKIKIEKSVPTLLQLDDQSKLYRNAITEEVESFKDWQKHDLSEEEHKAWGDLVDDMGPFTYFTQTDPDHLEKVNFLSVDEKTLTIEAPSKLFHSEKMCFFRLEAFREGNKVEIQGKSIPLTIEKTNEDFVVVSVELPHNSSKQVIEIEKMIEQRQTSVINFMKSAKGM